MKKVVFMIMAVLLVAGAAWAKDFEFTKKMGDYSVTAAMDKNPPIRGDNSLTIVLKDAAGSAIEDARVSVDYSMPAMPGMPPMNYKANTELQGGEYKGTLNFSMSGPWNVTVKVKRGGKTKRAKFNVDVR